MITLQLVQFDTSEYAVRSRERWLGDWEYRDLLDGGAWSIPYNVKKYCITQILDEAEKAMTIAAERISKNRKEGEVKPLKITKVIKSIKI